MLGLVEDVDPSFGWQAEEAVEQSVGEGRQEGLSVLARSRDARELEGLERRLARTRSVASYSGTAIGPVTFEQLIDRVGRDAEHPVDLVVAGLVGVQPEGVLGARREVGGPVRVRELPWLLRAQEVVGQLAGRLDVGEVPREVQEEDVAERPLRDPAAIESR